MQKDLIAVADAIDGALIAARAVWMAAHGLEDENERESMLQVTELVSGFAAKARHELAQGAKPSALEP